MSEGKYGKYIVHEPRGLVMVPERQTLPIFGVRGLQNLEGMGMTLGCSCITEPWFMETEIMKHDFDQIVCFLGANPFDFFDFHAEIEFSFGEEMEKHVITSASTIFIPRGLVHCPLNFTRVDSPILFMDISLTAEYSRRLREGKDWGAPLTLEDLKKRM
jgi:hypothetical protein